jgi:type I restriction enzyme, S subunit
MKAGWIEKSLGDICSIARGGSPRPIQAFLTSDSDGINWVKISDATASGKYIYETAEKIKPSGAARSRIVKDGDFLLSNSMSFGRPYIMRTTGCVHDGWLVLSEYQESFNQDFLYHLLGSPQVFSQFDRLAAGSTVRNLNIELASKVIVPIPTLEEQHRIVTLLDEVFADIATAKTNAEKNLQNARDFFSGQLQAIFESGSNSWSSSTLGQTYDVRDGTHDSPKYQAEGYPLITSKNLKREGLSFDDVKLIAELDYAKINERSAVHQGDVLLAMIGTIGNPTVVEIEPNFAIKNVALLKVPQTQNSYFLQYYLSTPLVIAKMQSEAKGTTQKFVGLGYLRAFPISIPALAEQQMIVEKLDELRTESDRLESIYRQKLTALDDLKKSLLHQAFSGQL